MYATVQDMIDSWGLQEMLVVGDRDNDEAIDTAVVEAALVRASATIDGYLGVVYDLPLSSTPPQLTTFCVDLAMYDLSKGEHYMTDDKRARRKDAIDQLKDIAKGRFDLPVATKSQLPERGAALVEAEGRLFNRNDLRNY